MMATEPIVNIKARPKGEKRRSRLPMALMVMGVLAALIVVPFYLLRPQADVFTLRSYETAVVQQGTLLEFVRGSGVLVPRLERSLIAPGEGVLGAWRVAEGDEVTEGQALGSLRSPDVERDLVRAEEAVATAERRLVEVQLGAESDNRRHNSSIEEARQTLRNAETRLETERRLLAIGAAARADVTAAEQAQEDAARSLRNAQADADNAARRGGLNVEEARATLGSAQREVARVRERAAFLELAAPIGGRVLRLSADGGESVNMGETLVTIASSTDLRVTARLLETQARRVEVGQRANLRVAGADYEGSVVAIAQQAEAGAEGGAVVPVTLAFDGAPEGLRMGASASVEIEVGRKEDAHYLPRGAFLTTGGERLVYVIEGSRAYRQSVIFGLVDGNLVEVREGLTAGQRIITTSYEAFKDRAEVALATEGEVR